MDFSGKVVLITGAGTGIGAATAKYLTALGASVVLTGRNAENLQRTREECEALDKAQPLLLVADVTKPDDNRRIIDETIKAFGKLDVLVNNAGKGAIGTIETTTMTTFDDIITTNLRAVYHLTKLAVPHLIESGGNIVNVSSVAGTRSFANFSAYCISKAALDQFTRCSALELAPKQVRVNSVNPATVSDTEFHGRLGVVGEAYENYLEHSKTTHALGRSALSSEVAAAIAFLAGDTASFITGVQLGVDGGRNVMCPV